MRYSRHFIAASIALILVFFLLGCSVEEGGMSHAQHIIFSNVKWKSETFSPHSRFMKRNERRSCKLGKFNEEKHYFEAIFDGFSRRIYSIEEFSPEYIVSHPKVFLNKIRKLQNEIIQTESFAARVFVFEERLVYDEVYGRNVSVCVNKVFQEENNDIDTNILQHTTVPLMQIADRVRVPFIGEGYFFKKEKKSKDEYLIKFYRIILWLTPSNDSDTVNQSPVKVGNDWFHFPSMSVLAVCIQEAS